MAVDPARAKSLFLVASDLADPAERAAYLDRECGAEPELRARVEALLRAHDAAPLPEPGQADATGTFAPDAPTADYPATDAQTGMIIAGKYTLVELIGEGGMGSVWRAQQTEPVKRHVAVKLIKTGLDSKQVLARFEAERQALALMDHPNIAKVLDGGLTKGEPGGVSPGRPFFVMELVKGVSIADYCDQGKLTLRARLELFVLVCQAIQHAHQKGIIHRDIKPSNVLIALYDDKPVPKVIDFGVAKATGVALTERTIDTGLGGVVGTLEYMSPEQASLNHLDIDTRSDVYALGVLLYELLTGTTPLDRKSLGKAALLEMLRIVREVEAPRPSVKLSTIDALPTVAANRGTEPAKLSKLLQGELDWLVLRALEKDRTRRYESANGLARDIQRYLADEVVEARPPSVGYRLSKFVRRHRGQVLAASLVLLALLVGVVGTTLGLLEAQQQAQLAREEMAEKEDALLVVTQRVQERDEANGKRVKAREKLLNVGARGLLRPLAARVPLHQRLPPLNDPEIAPLWELATTTDEDLRLRFVELALDDPVLRRRLTDRAPFAFQAAVGLDPRRRTRIEELLGKRLQAKEITPKEQEQVALCLAHLGGLERRLARRTAAILTQAMTKTTDAKALRSLAQALSALSARLEPTEAAQVCKQAATLIQAMSKTTDRDALESLAQVLSAVSARLEPKDAAEVAATLTHAMSKTTSPYTLKPLAQGLSAAALRLESKDAVKVAATLTQAMTSYWEASQFLAQSLSAVTTRLEPKDAAEVAADLAQAMSKTTDWNSAGPSLAQSLSAVAARLEPKDATKIAATLTHAMSKTEAWYAWRALGQGLSAVAARLEPKEAAHVCGQAAAPLLQAMSKTKDRNTLQNLAGALSRVTARLEPRKAAKVSVTLIQVFRKSNPALYSNDLNYLAQGLAAVAARLEPKEAAEVAVALTQPMSETTDPFALEYLAQGLSDVAARLEAKEAAQMYGQATAILAQAMSKTAEWHDLQSLYSPHSVFQPLAQALSTLSARLEPKEAAQLCGQAAAPLLQAMSKTTNPNALQFLGQSLSVVLSRDPPAQTLVELLKHPLCVGEGRRLVLNQLSRHYRRSFADQWDFVDYAQQQQLGLDLTTPPARSKMLP